MNKEENNLKKSKGNSRYNSILMFFIVFYPYNWALCNGASDFATALGCPFCLNFMFPIGFILASIPFSLSEGQARAMLHWFLLNFPLLV